LQPIAASAPRFQEDKSYGGIKQRGCYYRKQAVASCTRHDDLIWSKLLFSIISWCSNRQDENAVGAGAAIAAVIGQNSKRVRARRNTAIFMP
jgi:hypothetical protein